MASEPDMFLINELLEEIERQPPGIEARKLLVEQFMTAGWMDAARDAVQELSTVCNDADVKGLAAALARNDESQPPPPYLGPASSLATLPTKSFRSPASIVAPASLPTESRELQIEKQNLVQGYNIFRTKAKDLLRHHHLLQGFKQRKGLTSKDIHTKDLENLAAGRIISVLKGQPAPSDQLVTVSVQTPNSARAVAKKLLANPESAPEILLKDLEYMLEWLPASMDNDNRREMLAKRIRTLNAALPSTMHYHTLTAMMHMEHEQLGRKYVNDETMLGDAISEIPREEFFTTEDNYAWSMDELVQAITSNKGVFRNPLSKHMFTPNDIASILQHPLGKPLAALQIEQSKLKKGVRPKTIEEMDRMANVFMEDMEDSALKSREAIDEFLAYLATLPVAEQQAIDKLSVPAKDSHTGQAFDGTIGEAVRDAKANKLCFHKAGDFIRQAAGHLRKRQFNRVE